MHAAIAAHALLLTHTIDYGIWLKKEALVVVLVPSSLISVSSIQLSFQGGGAEPPCTLEILLGPGGSSPSIALLPMPFSLLHELTNPSSCLRSPHYCNHIGIQHSVFFSYPVELYHYNVSLWGCFRPFQVARPLKIASTLLETCICTAQEENQRLTCSKSKDSGCGSGRTHQERARSKVKPRLPIHSSSAIHHCMHHLVGPQGLSHSDQVTIMHHNAISSCSVHSNSLSWSGMHQCCLIEPSDEQSMFWQLTFWNSKKLSNYYEYNK